MNYYICPGCGQRYCGWSNNKICQKCKKVLKRITREEFYPDEKIEGIEADVADLKLQGKVNEYKERYPEHFKK